MRLMNFFLAVRPLALLAYHVSFTCMSLASEPEAQKRIFEASQGAISFSFSASSIAVSCDLPPKMWVKESLRIWLAAASTISSLP